MTVRPKKLSVLLVPSGPQRIASARLRAFQYLSPLRNAGIRCRIFPATSDVIARLRVLSPRMSRFTKYGYYVVGVLDQASHLIPILLRAHRYDVVYLQRATFPIGVARLLRWINPRIIFDFDDAIHLRDPADGESGLIGTIKERAKARGVPDILRVSRCAIVEHGILEAYARQYCSRVETIPGPVDTELFHPRQIPRRKGPIVIGWIGTPSTSAFLPIALPALQRISERHDIEVHLVGSGTVDLDGIRVKIFQWQEHEETIRLQAFDIGIMPMPDTEWTRGKLGLKMLLYMATGIPAVVSYTPANAEVIDHGVNGFIAKDDRAWEEILERLIVEPSLRDRIGGEGRRTVESGFSLNNAVPKLVRILYEVAHNSGRR